MKKTDQEIEQLKKSWLFSASGSLMVMLDGTKEHPMMNKPTGGKFSAGGVNQENCITEIPIKNDGGDW